MLSFCLSCGVIVTVGCTVLFSTMLYDKCTEVDGDGITTVWCAHDHRVVNSLPHCGKYVMCSCVHHGTSCVVFSGVDGANNATGR